MSHSIGLNMKNKIRAFIKGMGSILNLMPLFKVAKFTKPNISVEEALGQDWINIGNDLRMSIRMTHKEFENMYFNRENNV